MNDSVRIDRVQADIDALLSAGADRSVGSEGNRIANAFAAERLAAAGCSVERLSFDCVDWRRGTASLSVDGRGVEIWPGPYSPPIGITATLLTAEREDDLADLADARGCVLFLHGPLVSDQLTPRNYPFYRWDTHTRILGHLDRLAPAAVIAATGSNPSTVGALSPYPYIEDADFCIPSAYIHEKNAETVARQRGRSITLVIDSDRFKTSAEQVVGTLGAGRGRRVVLSAHIDSRFGTPGALDNAAGVACLLGAADLLGASHPEKLALEFLPFNGEDNFAAYGEMAYLESRGQRFDDIALHVNVDAAGFLGHPTSLSRYNLTPQLDEIVDRALADSPTVQDGPQWPASDHMIFAMKGVPALAVTTEAFNEVCAEYTHTERDVGALLDPSLLADAAESIAAVVLSLDRQQD